MKQGTAVISDLRTTIIGMDAGLQDVFDEYGDDMAQHKIEAIKIRDAIVDYFLSMVEPKTVKDVKIFMNIARDINYKSGEIMIHLMEI